MKRIMGYSFLVFLDFVLVSITGKNIYIILGLALIVWGLWTAYGEADTRMKIYFLIIILSNIILAFVRTNHYENFIGRIEQEIRLKPHLEISGTVLKVEERTKNTKVLIKVKSVRNNRHNFVRSNLRGTKGNLYFVSESRDSVDSGTSSLIPGQRITVFGEVSPLEKSRNDGGYSERDNLYGQSVYFKMFRPSVQQIDRRHGIFREQDSDAARGGVRGMLYRFSVALESEFRKNLPAEEGTLVSEMCIGTKSDGNEMVKDLFRLAGIISLLSISGTHVSVVSRSLYNLLRRHRLSFLESMVISVMVALLYGGLCGNSISTVRAIACFSLMTFAQVLGMSYDSVTALAAVAYFMVIRNPYIVYNSSFQLSFGIMFGVVYVAYPASVRIRTTMRRVWNLKHKNSGVESYRLNTKDRIRIYVLMMFLIQLWSIPIVSYLFYEIPTYSCLANVVLMPLFPVLLICALFGSLLSLLGEGLISAFIFSICHALIYGFEVVSDMLTRLPFYHIVTGKPSELKMALYFAIMLIVFSDFYRFGRRTHRLACAALLAIMLVPLPRGKSVNMLYVGQGDGLHISLGRGRDICIDGGSTSQDELGKYTLDPYFKSNRITEIDSWFVTHTDLDHISGLLDELRSGMRIREVVTSPQVSKTPAFCEIERLAKRNGTRIRLVEAGEKYIIGKKGLEDVSSVLPLRPCIEVLSPDAGLRSDDVNDYSLVFLLRDDEGCKGNAGFSGLFTGDLSGELEEKYLTRFKKVNLLKACHHGSNLSNSEDFLRQVSPDLIIISAGIGNRYGHPGKKALARMDKLHLKHVCTISNGQISVEYGGGRMWWRR